MLEIRPARQGDAERMAVIQLDAIRNSFSGFYSATVISVFSGTITAERLQPGPGRPARLAGILDGDLVAFGSLRDEGMIGGIYAGKAAQRRGVGRSLLLAVEELARKQGLDSLSLDATLNAEGFYALQGYERLGDKLLMISEEPCVEMRVIAMAKRL